MGDRENYAAAVERLLASPHYGERWGRIWLDAARYADSDGFEKDKPRFVWMYRDWVVNALNRDLPYNQFVIEQIAGDLLPNATQDQLVATGFLRNSMINEEGGIDPEQFRMEAMFDRMDAIGKGMLGLTIQCCQCHTHKYDPLTQTEYYRMFAFLNNCARGEGRRLSRREQQMQRADVLRHDRRDRSRAAASHARLAGADGGVGRVGRGTISRSGRSSGRSRTSSGGQKHYVLEDGSILAQGYAPTKHTTEFAVEDERREDHGGAAGAAERSESAAGRAGPVDLRHVRADRIQASRPAPADGSAKLADVKIASGDGRRESAREGAGIDLRRQERTSGA